jgi:hypothetical protein|tara:strand:- start:74 stop:991 length:918 start_codon:yes stop_codon:yes gene_type:complete
MEKFVTVLLNGGLGNQLYQYSFGRSLSIKHNCRLNLDLSIFDTFHNTWKNTYRLDNFKIDSDTVISKNFSSFQLLNLKLITKFFRKNVINFYFSDFILNKKFNKIFFDWDFKKQRTDILKISQINSIYFGYWQDIKYFDHIRPLLNNELSLKEKLINPIEELSKNFIKPNSVAVHIRGGDMEYDNNYTYVDNDYYVKSLSFFKKKFGKISLNIMTDDIKLAKKQLSRIIKDTNQEINFFYDLNLNDLEEFYLFKQHKNFISSRSTFSWWSSYLCNNEDKVITLPSEWFIGEETLKSRIAKNMLVI